MADASAEVPQMPGIPGYDPENIQPWTVKVVVSMTILSLASCALRLCSRWLKGQKLWWDDYLILFSMVCQSPWPLIPYCD